MNMVHTRRLNSARVPLLQCVRAVAAAGLASHGSARSARTAGAARNFLHDNTMQHYSRILQIITDYLSYFCKHMQMRA
jgi:hypothetical protein